jgi:phosphohistidine swiveling domain-containing protein
VNHRYAGVPVIGHVKGDLRGIPDGTRLHLDARHGVVTVLGN